MGFGRANHPLSLLKGKVSGTIARLIHAMKTRGRIAGSALIAGRLTMTGSRDLKTDHRSSWR